VHGRLGSFVKSVEMDRGDYSLDRLKSKFGKVLGYGVSIQYASSQGQGAVSNDKQLEDAIADSVKRGKYNVEVILIKDGSSVKSVGDYVTPKQTSYSKPSTPSSSSSNYSSSSSPATSTPSSSYSKPVESKQTPSYSSSTPSSSSSSSSGNSLIESLKAEINKMRTNTNAYIAILEERAKAYDGTTLMISKGDTKFKTKTHEGRAAVDEAINSLRSLGRLPAYEFPKTLGNCANEVANKVGTKPVDKNVFGNIIESHGSYNGELKLLRGYFYEHDDSQDLVVHFLTSDGDKNRTSRNILLSSNLRNGGIAIVEGPYPKLCTLMFVSEWK